MESERKQKIEATVLEILESCDWSEVTEFKVRNEAAERLQMDLNDSESRWVVRGVVESFLRGKLEESIKASEEERSESVVVEEERHQGSHKEEQESEAAEELLERTLSARQEEQDSKTEEQIETLAVRRDEQESKPEEQFEAPDGVVCKLSSRRHVVFNKYRGTNLVSIREYYPKDGKLHPSAKGISLTVAQWSSLKNSTSAIDEAIEKMISRKK